MENSYKISSKPVSGRWTVRTRSDNRYLGTIEPLGPGMGYRAVGVDGNERTERLRMFAALWLVGQREFLSGQPC